MKLPSTDPRELRAPLVPAEALTPPTSGGVSSALDPHYMPPRLTSKQAIADTLRELVAATLRGAISTQTAGACTYALQTAAQLLNTKPAPTRKRKRRK